VTVCGDGLALSLIVIEAVELPAVAAVNVTESVQLEPAATLVPQLLVCAKFVALVPPSVIDVMDSAALPVFVNCTVCAALVTVAGVVKLSDPGVSKMLGAVGAVATPASGSICGDVPALSAITRAAAKLPALEDEKVTDRLQLAPAARLVPQVFVCAKADGLVPARAIEVIVSAAVPVFCSCTICAALGVPATAVKLSEAGVSETDATGVAMKFAVTVCGAVSVTVVAALALAATGPVQLVKVKPAFGVAATFTTVPAA
jgi:hypothetical protein